MYLIQATRLSSQEKLVKFQIISEWGDVLFVLCTSFVKVLIIYSCLIYIFLYVISIGEREMSDSTETAAQEAKVRGNKALATKQYAAAIQEYSKAIELDPTQAVFYSNRCAAYLQSNDSDNLDKALEDAESCIANKRGWAKGYARKGSVLSRQKQYKQAIAAYEQAIEFSPEQTNVEYSKAIEKITELQVSNASVESKQKSDRLFYNMLSFLHLAIILTTLAYLVLGGAFFYLALKISGVTQVVSVIRTYGRPQFNKAYWGQVASHPDLHFIMPALFLHAGAPFLLGLLPACIRAVLFLAQAVAYYKLPAIFTENSKKIIAAQRPLVSLIASLEIGVGLLQLFLLLTPSRNFLLVLLSWQYLRMRYMTGYDMKSAFGQLRAKLDTVFQHRYIHTYIHICIMS